MQRLVIVGGVAGGASAAARARRLCESAKITILERGPDVSFANCGLPYHIGGEINTRDKLLLHTPASLRKELAIDIRVLSEVRKLDLVKKELAVFNYQTKELANEPYDKLIIATGAAPVIPRIPGLETTKRVHILRTLQDMDAILAQVANSKRKRNKALIIGAGFIGLEMAESLRHQGLAVTVVEKKNRLLPLLDGEMSAPLLREASANDIRVLVDSSVNAFADLSDGVRVRVKGPDSNESEEEGDFVVLSIGVSAEAKLAGDAGIELDKEFRTIKVNQHMQTSDPSVYAVGDVVSTQDLVFPEYRTWVPLGGPANRQARIAADHIFMPETAPPYRGSLGTSILRFFDMSAGIVGWTEQRLQACNIPYEHTIITSYNHAAYFPGAVPIVLKILWEKGSGRLVGAQANGCDGVDKRLDVLATAIAGKMTVEDLAHLELSYAPPFNSARDVVNVAGLAGSNLRSGIAAGCSTIFKGAVVVDVRETTVADLQPFPGAIRIPMSELRARVGELDPAKRYVTVCAFGKTSYFAARIMRHHGLDVLSLTGGVSIRMPKLVDLMSKKNYPTQDNLKPPTHAPSDSKVTAAPKEVKLDACGMACPGPIMAIRKMLDSPNVSPGDSLCISASDPGFMSDFKHFCDSNGVEYLGVERGGKGVFVGKLRVPETRTRETPPALAGIKQPDMSMVVFSGDLDKVLAALVIANGHVATSTGKVTMFFTFWGLNALRRPKPPAVSKSFLDRAFGWMLPNGLDNLPLSNMHWFGLGTWMMKYTMAKKSLPNVSDLLKSAQESGRVRIVACTMSMDALGISQAELVDGVDLGGVANFLGAARNSGTTLFI